MRDHVVTRAAAALAAGLILMNGGASAGEAGGAAARPAMSAPAADPSDPLRDAREIHLSNVRQLTFGGENAEAYWSADGRRIIFQSKRDGAACDQMYVMDADGSNVRRVSNGLGKTTCGYFFPDGRRILYSSTHLGSPECPPDPDYSKGYVWALYPSYEILTADSDGANPKRLTDNPGYDAEATISPDGSRVIFTSMRNGDLDLYTMRPDGTDVRRLTSEPGYDGGAFYSRDGRRIVWRASRPSTAEERAAYEDLLRESAIRPMALEIFTARADGSKVRKVTSNGAANFAPYFHPDGRRILFASNVGDPGGRNFDIWMVRDDGSDLEQITFNDTFDGFPMFSPDGRKLLFASNRNGKARGETNVFVADWVEPKGRRRR